MQIHKKLKPDFSLYMTTADLETERPVQNNLRANATLCHYKSFLQSARRND